MSEAENPLIVHLISDATGTTLQGVARACLAQFDDIAPEERFWPLVRTEKQLMRIVEQVAVMPGPVLFTLVDPVLRTKLEAECAALGVPFLSVLDPVIKGLAAYLGLIPKGIPGLQHVLNEAYFDRIEAMEFTLSFDDGQSLDGIEKADVILVGVSRTSKTPTCIYLAHEGVRAANVPWCPGVPFPEKVLALKDVKGKAPLFVALTESPDRLVNVRRTRLREEGHAHPGHEDNRYIDPERVEEEVREARRFYARQGWPVIDVTRRSVEETAAEILFLMQKQDDNSGVTEM